MIEGNIKQHWFCFTFKGRDLTMWKDATANTYKGFTTRDPPISLAVIKDACDFAGMCSDAVLLNVCYLGCMTRDEFDV